MDIRCPKCGEPWEIDSLHEEVTERFGHWDPEATPRYNSHLGKGATVLPKDRPYEDLFAEVRRDFYRRGCEALGGRHSHANASPAIAEVFDVLGDDIDGAAVFLEDLEHEGLL